MLATKRIIALTKPFTRQTLLTHLPASQQGWMMMRPRFLSTEKKNDTIADDEAMEVHFRASGRQHPLQLKKVEYTSEDMGDHMGRQQNHIWTKEELHEKMTTLYRHKPETFTDHAMNKLMYGLYHTFNFITGYSPIDPTPKAIEWRLIVLESVAGVPGFVAAGIRHFRSLRQLKKDYGWIPTLLEEAENERMHLRICLNTFKATTATRALVLAVQYTMAPFLMAVYLTNPKAMHRFVGYLEETACATYVNTINHIETPGTKLHTAWANLAAPPLAIGYYRMPKDAMWVDTLKCMMADEANHRDVNHTFACMKSDDPNPFLQAHKEDAAFAWRLEASGEPAWPEKAALEEKLSKEKAGGDLKTA
eukprot:gene4928-5410_t